MGIYAGKREGREIIMKKLAIFIFILTIYLFSKTSLGQDAVIKIPENAGVDPDFFKKYDPQGPALEPPSPPALSSVLSRAEKLREKALIEIKKLENEIGKNAETIKKSEKIIILAQQKGNIKAESVARDALAKTQEAKRKNEEILRFYKIYLNLLAQIITKLESSIFQAAHDECNCEQLRRKYEGFKKAIKDFTKSVQGTAQEYQEWEKEWKEAQIEGFQAFVNGLAFQAQYLKNIREEKLQILKRQLDGYMRKLSNEELLKNKYILERLNAKMAKANQYYLETEDAIRALEKVDKTIKVQDLMRATTNSINLWCLEIKKGDTEVLNLLKDPEIKGLSIDLTESFGQYALEYIEMIKATDKVFGPLLRRFNLAISGLTLLRDVSYAGTHLKLSFDRLMKLGEVGEQNYRAMQSLIENKKALEVKLKECHCSYNP